MSAAAGAAFARPFRGADYVKALVHTAAAASSSSSSTCSSAPNGGAILSRKATIPSSRSPWPPQQKGTSSVRKKMDSFGFLGQQDETRSLAELCKCLRHAPEQPIYPNLMFRSRVREGGADSESKGSNHDSWKNTLKQETSLLLSLVKEVQPLDVSHISKEVSSDSTDAMKRTISGMLGLLPSDQFHVAVETSPEPLAKLFVSSMMTGYTLRNAEYRLCLQKSLEFSGVDGVGEPSTESAEHALSSQRLKTVGRSLMETQERDISLSEAAEDVGLPFVGDDGLDSFYSVGSISEEARLYILHLQQKVASVTKELEECKRINTGLQVQSIVGEEKNDLLDYLRSLSPDKVAELSEPSSTEVEGVIQEVINGLFDSPLTKLQSKASQYSTGTASSFNSSWEEENVQKLSSSSPLQSQSVVNVNRDHLARLLFWCMLLGHYMRGLEYRLELSRTLSLSGDLDSGCTEIHHHG